MVNGSKNLMSQHGKEVSVRHSISLTRDNLHVIEIRAHCGQMLEVSRVTIGSVDGARAHPPTKEALQHTLDTHRQRVADEASWKETVRENIQWIK